MTIALRMNHARRLPALGLAIVTSLAASAAADEVLVKPVTFPAAFLDRAETPGAPQPLDRVLEASAVSPIGDGRLVLVAHDKKVPLRVIEAATGRPVGAPLFSSKFPEETPKSAKWEAMARDSEGTFYVIGSHSGKTEDERKQHLNLIRFRLAEAADGLSIDDGSVASWRIDAALVRSLQSLGLPQTAVDQRKIEGLAIRESETDGRNHRQLVIGLRQPDDQVRAFAADLSSNPADAAELPLTPLFSFEPGTREGVRSQLTSLEYLPAWKGFLVVTATEDEDNAFHGNTLWFVADDRIAEAKGAPVQAEKLWVFEAAMKAEGLCILPTPADSTTARILIVYDNDAHTTHIPSRFQVVDLTRLSRASH